MKKLLFLGFITFLITAVWLLPLSIAKPYLEEIVSGLKLADVKGTIWKGESNNFSANNMNFGKVKWEVSPFKSLSTLSLSSSFKINGEDISALGNAHITPQQQLILKDTQFNIDTHFINQLQKNAHLKGDFKGSIKQATFEFDQKNLPIIDAVINWKEGAVSSPIKLSPGDYHAIIRPDSNGLIVTLSSNDAPAELSGNIKLNKEWGFETDLNIKAKDQGLSSMLGLVGKKQPDGTILIKQKGTLKPFIKKAPTGKQNG